MKLFKKLAALCLSLTMCLGLGATFAACDGDDTNSSSSVQEEIAYKFKVLKADGSAAVGYRVLLCEGTLCYGPAVVADSNGIALYLVSKLPAPKAYDIHVMSSDTDDSTYLTLTSSSLKLTPTDFSETVTITLTLAE